MRAAVSTSHGGPHPRMGFTLLELLVSMGIISLLAVLLLPILPMARRHARDARCKSNLSQVWKTVNIYANNHKDVLFQNYDTPMRVSNVAYSQGRPTGLGCLYPLYLKEIDILFCPDDPVRDSKWEHGWDNWGTEDGEVQLSYGYRGGQGLLTDPSQMVTLATVDSHPKKVFAVEFYEPFLVPPRVHHPRHINLVRCWGQVEQMDVIPSFGPTDEDIEAALGLLDR